MSLLAITSHHHAHRSSASLVLHHTKPAARLVPAPDHHQLFNREHGTKVNVHDLFGNMPVRVKQRGLLMSSDKEHTREWDSMRRSIVGLSLAWKNPVNAIIRNQAVKRKMTLTYRNSALTYRNSALEETTADPQCSKPLDLSWICSLLTQAGYIEQNDRKAWIKTSARTPFITIRGAFSLQPVPTKRIQFISLGIRLVGGDTGGSVLYDEVNRKFALSSFGNSEDSSDDEVAKKKKNKDNRYKEDGHTNKQLRGGGKGVDRWPMFVIRIELQRCMSGRIGGRETLEQESTLSSIVKVLGAMTTEFLSDHHFRPRKQRKGRRPVANQGISGSPAGDQQALAKEASTSLSFATAPGSRPQSTQPASRASVSNRYPAFGEDELNSPIPLPNFRLDRTQYVQEGFNTWSRIKSGTARVVEDGFLADCTRSTTSRQGKGLHYDGLGAEARLVHERVKCSVPNNLSAGALQLDVPDIQSSPGGTHGMASELVAGEFQMNPEAEDTITWIDPTTKASMVLNARTGQVVPLSSKRSCFAAGMSHDGALPRMTTKAGFDRLTRRASIPVVPKAGSWASDFLKNWDNPVFSPSIEPGIPQVSFEGPTQEDPGIAHGGHRRCSNLDIERAFSEPSSAFSARIPKAGLKKARVISQLDKKFILLLMDASPHSQSESKTIADEQQVLVLVDQHAADERVRVESLLTELCAEPSPETLRMTWPLDQKPAVAIDLLSKPLKFPVKSCEYRLLTAHAQHFADWGILYDLSSACHAGSTSMESPRQMIIVKALPPVIAERCRMEPKLLIEILRKEIWKRDEHGRRAKPPSSCIPDDNGDLDKGSWLNCITSCPQGILDMLNSRSCRSAIMFNDQLEIGECETLVRRLAECHFPFQCAHGRPSLVPLVAVGDEWGFGCREAEGDEGFVGAWRRWTAEERQGDN